MNISKRLTTKCKQSRRIKDYGVPLLIYLIGFGIVFRYAIVDYTLVSDAGNEFLIYKLATETGKWQIIEGQRLLSSCLWTSYIPAMFQRFFNTDLVMTFKLFPCFIFPILPVFVYFLARKIVTPFYAFLTSSFLMMQIYYLWMPRFARIGVSLVFFSIIIFVVFNENLRLRTKAILLVVLSAGLVTSHYGVTYVSLWGLFVASVLVVILRKIIKINYPYLRILFVSIGILVLVVMLWHSLFNPTIVGVGRRVVQEAVELKIYVEERPITEGDSAVGDTPATEEETYGYWSLESREEVIQVAFGKTLPDMNIPQKIEFAVSWITILLMSWGLVIVAKRGGVRRELVILMGACYLTIVGSIIVPTIGARYGIARVYFHMMVLLSICFVVGSTDVAKRLRIPSALLTAVVIVVFGLSTSGLMHNIFGLSR